MAGKVTLLARKFMLGLQVHRKFPDITTEAGGGLRSPFFRGMKAAVARVSTADGSSWRLRQSWHLMMNLWETERRWLRSTQVSLCPWLCNSFSFFSLFREAVPINKTGGGEKKKLFSWQKTDGRAASKSRRGLKSRGKKKSAPLIKYKRQQRGDFPGITSAGQILFCLLSQTLHGYFYWQTLNMFGRLHWCFGGFLWWVWVLWHLMRARQSLKLAGGFIWKKKTFLSLLKQAVMFNQGMSDSLGPAL